MSPVFAAEPHLKINPIAKISYEFSRSGCGRVGQGGIGHSGLIRGTMWSSPITFHVSSKKSNEDGEKFLVFSATCRDLHPLRELSRGFDSWQSMLLTQPPITAVLVRTQPKENGDWEPRMTLYNPSGITLGDVFNMMQSEVVSAELSKPGSSFELMFGQKLAIDDECNICRWVEEAKKVVTFPEKGRL